MILCAGQGSFPDWKTSDVPTSNKYNRGGITKLLSRLLFCLSIGFCFSIGFYQSAFAASDGTQETIPSAAESSTEVDQPTNTLITPIEQDAAAPLPQAENSIPQFYKLKLPAQMQFIEQQIQADEASEALSSLNARITEIEQRFHRYHGDLVIPLTLKGDALLAENQIIEAIDTFERARHVARVSNGLFDAKQIPIVYREAHAYNAAGDPVTAIKREEYAFEIASTNFGKFSPQLLPAIYRLAKYYVKTHNYASARQLFSRAVRIHNLANTLDSPAATTALRGIAHTRKLQRFPPVYIQSTYDDDSIVGPAPGLRSGIFAQENPTFTSYTDGEDALQKIVDIRRNEDPINRAELFRAVIELADWHLMFEHYTDAKTLYEYAFQLGAVAKPDLQEAKNAESESAAKLADNLTEDELENTAVVLDSDSTSLPIAEAGTRSESTGSALEDSEAKKSAELEKSNSIPVNPAIEFFSEPRLIYFPLPDNPDKPNQENLTALQGHVKLSFGVSANGRIRNLETLESVPEKLMDFRVRRSMRIAIFRPKLVDGIAVMAKDQVHTHNFPYHAAVPAPTLEKTAGEELGNESEDSANQPINGEPEENPERIDDSLEVQESTS